jgi:2-amino-4-hydroxy-6-hydroxymethyldihydropteridine diphosphokinase
VADLVRAYVGVGANVEPAANVRRALAMLARRERLVSVSTVYRTAALGRPEQPDYYNCVVALDTETPPLVLQREVLREIEAALGRVRGPDRCAARPIDLDLLAYDDVLLHTEELTLPSPEIGERAFVALPLAELAPSLPLPAGSAAEVGAGFTAAGMVPLPDYTALLRQELGIG